MTTVTEVLEFSQPAETIWEVAGDLARLGEWRYGHTGFPDGVPVLEPHQTFKEGITLLGMPSEAEWTVAAVDPPTMFSLTGKGPMGVVLDMRLELEQRPAGTLVKLETSFEGGLLIGPLQGKLTDAARQANVESLQKLSEVVV